MKTLNRNLTDSELTEIEVAIKDYEFGSNENPVEIQSENFLITAQQTIHSLSEYGDDHIISDFNGSVDVAMIEFQYPDCESELVNDIDLFKVQEAL